MPQLAIDIARQFEGFSPRPYRCPAGIPTIGYGHVIPSMDHPVIDRPEGDRLLTADMHRAINAALRLCPVLAAYPEKLEAVSDFVFNLGAGRLAASTLRRRINERRWSDAARELSKWVWGGGQKLPGLVLRRAVEARYLTA